MRFNNINDACIIVAGKNVNIRKYCAGLIIVFGFYDSIRSFEIIWAIIKAIH